MANIAFALLEDDAYILSIDDFFRIHEHDNHTLEDMKQYFKYYKESSFFSQDENWPCKDYFFTQAVFQTIISMRTNQTSDDNCDNIPSVLKLVSTKTLIVTQILQQKVI